MKFLFFLSLLASAGSLLATALPASSLKASLRGTVEADGTGPLEYATVSAFLPDSSLVDGTVTDANGAFALSLPKGGYRLRIEFIGFAAREMAVNLTGNLDLGAINLSGGVDLSTVEVRAERSSMTLQLDKKVFNVGEDALAAGGTANEVLEQIPSVTVSPDGAVALRGDGGVRILINGRPSALADRGGLAGIPAASIERVEVITNPSAKYEASGTAGILNIILKQESQRGYGGSVSVGAGIPDNHTLDVNLNYRSEKLLAFATVGGRYSNFNGSSELRRITLEDGNTSLLSQSLDMARNDLAGNGFFGADYNLSSTAVLSGSYSVFHMRNDDVSTLGFAFVPNLAPAAAPNSVLQQRTEYLEPGTYQQTDLTFARTLPQAGRKYTVYFKNDRWREPEYEDISLTRSVPVEEQAFRYRTDTDEGSNDFLLQADYETPLGEGGQLEVGARGETRIISSTYSAELDRDNGFEPIPGFTNDFDYYERIGAVYAQYGRQFEKVSLRAGLRAEATAVRTEDELETTTEVDRDYLNLFPSLSLQYALSEAVSSQVSYGRRIRRPAFWMLNPFGGIGNPTQIYRGNPLVDPIYISRVEWNLLVRADKWTFNPAVYASRVKDFLKTIYEREPENIFGLPDGTVTALPVNLGNEDLLGVELTASYRPTEKITLNGEFNYFGFRETGVLEGRDFAASGGAWRGSLRTQVQLPREINLSAFCAYNGGRRDAQELIRANYITDFSLSKKWSDQYTLSLNLRSPRFRNTESFRPSFTQTEDFTWTGWRAGLTLRYQFDRGAGSEGRRARGSIR
ncbi:TonB-dependent receptor domain-containing protein [Lewinella sp. 4G2]|uniref:TonB-dependent receptor domain-containing protein n=1 Tax=Lewinella sp. 4G2 TaxID=1803372 RepID=UPI0007B46D0A|nr:TonB-dependent receptor [Lewinella sp. 4G2]OAV43767.1 hypothetical protein A3850_004320 [Lewinella sp. 4G2]